MPPTIQPTHLRHLGVIAGDTRNELQQLASRQGLEGGAEGPVGPPGKGAPGPPGSLGIGPYSAATPVTFNAPHEPLPGVAASVLLSITPGSFTLIELFIGGKKVGEYKEFEGEISPVLLLVPAGSTYEVKTAEVGSGSILASYAEIQGGKEGPEGKEGKAGAGDLNFVFTEGGVSAVWTILHKLKKFPSVTVQDTAGDEVEGIVVYNSNEELTITFSAPFSGKAFLN